MSALTLYGREYCSLCTTMREQLASLAPNRGFSVRWVDIDDDDGLEERYGELVPVLETAEGKEICHYHLDLAALNDWLGAR
ncbi:glutaredoxin family protein [Andreprevotia chitinilytica]|uniref:glutaredoxin family protein n=1 Tax=Andreprevotia chitinilytica TaxID=396808 RepID=UPI000550311D|nr:glutaredoxin family protein [Andreprevotia chitinilytica]